MRAAPITCGVATLLFAAYPVAELIALVEMTRRRGPGFTLLWVLAAAAAGFILLRLEGAGVRMYDTLRVAMRRGEPPEVPILATVLRTAGAIFLILPGPVSDAFGVVLVCPPIARLLARIIAGPFAGPPPGAAPPGFGPRSPAIEGDVIGRRFVDEPGARNGGAAGRGDGDLPGPPEKG